MALSNKFLSPKCASAHGDIATYFFSKKIFRSDGGICVSMTSFWGSIPAKSNIFAITGGRRPQAIPSGGGLRPRGPPTHAPWPFWCVFASWESRQAAEGELQIFMPKKYYPTEICFDGRAWPCTRKPFHQKGRTKNAHGGALLEKGLLI